MRHSGPLVTARDAALRVPLFMKVLGIPLGLTVVLGAGLLWQIHVTWHRMLCRELEQRGALLGADLAAHGTEFVLTGQIFDLQRLLDDSQARFPDVEYLIVLDPRGRLVADTLVREPSPELLRANPGSADGAPRVVLLASEKGDVRDVAVPILDGQLGVLRVGMSERRVSYEVNWLTWRLAAVAAVLAALGMAAAWVLTTVLTRPIRELVGLTRAVKEGDYDARVAVRARDEVGELATAFNEMTKALRGKEAVRQELLRQVIAASEDERKRVARELHDNTGQSLASLIAGLGALATRSAASADEATSASLTELREHAEQMLQEVHDLSRTLRPSALDDLGLPAALQKHCDVIATRFGITVDCQEIGFDDQPRLPGEVEIAAYRIVQEALTNAVRHGGAQAVQVLLQRKDGALLLVVEDDGKGFDARDWRTRFRPEGHLGLAGIEERAALLGGNLRVESRPGSGTSLFIEVPLAGEEPAR